MSIFLYVYVYVKKIYLIFPRCGLTLIIPQLVLNEEDAEDVFIIII